MPLDQALVALFNVIETMSGRMIRIESVQCVFRGEVTPLPLAPLLKAIETMSGRMIRIECVFRGEVTPVALLLVVTSSPL